MPSNSNPPQHIHVFIAYARKDTPLMEELCKHLKVLEHNQLIHIWYDGKIDAGSKWDAEIKKHLTNADIILLLISADFIASDYAYQEEMKKALKMEEEGKAKVFPVILRHCGWKRTPFAKLQVLPKDGKPVNSDFWHNHDIPFTEVFNVVDATAQTLKAKRIATGEWAVQKENILESNTLYAVFVKQAYIHFHAKEWQNAMEKYNQALNIYQENFKPNRQILENNLNQCKKELNWINYKRIAKECEQKEN